MSCHIVEDNVIQVIVSYLQNDILYGEKRYQHAFHHDMSMRPVDQKSGQRLAQVLYDLNQRIFVDRCEHHEEVEWEDYTIPYKFTYESDTKKAYRALRQLVYQCTTAEYQELPYGKLLEEIHNSVGHALAFDVAFEGVESW